jgi:hypothetical protein
MQTQAFCSPVAAHLLVAEERHRRLLSEAAMHAATTVAGADRRITASDARAAVRVRLAAALIRAGQRLGGDARPVPA